MKTFTLVNPGQLDILKAKESVPKADHAYWERFGNRSAAGLRLVHRKP